MKVDRRAFLKQSTLGVLGASSALHAKGAGTESSEIEPQAVTLVQLKYTRDLDVNAAKAKEAIQQAVKDRAKWIVFPEMFLTGYTLEFDQERLAKIFDELGGLCHSARLIGLFGTGWNEKGKVANAVRIVDPDSPTVSQFSKTCLANGDAGFAVPAECPLVREVGGLKIGVVICNDLWVTPGSSTGSDPRLTWMQARAGARVIFHCIASGASQVHRAYHESNHLLRAWEANCDIVAVNRFTAPAINCTSGVIGPDFRYRAALPRDREEIRTVSFIPKSLTANIVNRSPVPPDAPAWRPD